MKLRSWSLRRRLVLTVALVALVGIVVVDIATYRSLQLSLLERIDGQLDSIAQQQPPGEDARRPTPPGQPQRPPNANQRATPAGTWMAAYRLGGDGEGAELIEEVVAGDGEIDRASDIPDVEITRATDAELRGRPTTIESADGSTDFRVQTRGLRDGDLMIVAVPLTDYEETLDRLRNIELIVSALAAFGVSLLALVMVRAGLRPLDAIAAAATDIAQDTDDRAAIGRRIPVDAAASTEIGQLAGALNEMLDQLDESLRAQQATQDGLRRFVMDASHELRTPLTSIQGYAELARLRAADMTSEERDTALLRVEQETEHVTRLVEDLLLLSRLDEGLQLTGERADVAELVARSVDAARVIEPSRTVDFESGGAVELVVDPVRVRQLVDNLLTNVRTHAGDGASAMVRVDTGDDVAGDVRISVSDTGVGIPDGEHDAATDRFWRADSSRTRATGGSGLGLSIVRSIAESHGGAVELASGPDGVGLTVSVTLRELTVTPK